MTAIFNVTHLTNETCTVQNLAEVIGLIVSSLAGEVYGPLHYCSLERNKTDTLRENKAH